MPDAATSPGPKTRVFRAARGFHQRVWPTAKYLFQTDVHTFAFSVAANAILSFFPFIVLLLTLIRFVFRSRAMNQVVLDLLRDYLPAGQDFILRNLNVLINARRGAQVASLAILLITSTGVFLPLEVALNRIWGFTRNRSYLGNQLVSLGLAFASGCLALLSVALTAGQQTLLRGVVPDRFVLQMITFVTMKVLAVCATITIFFLIYWILPAGRVPARAVLPAAVFTGLLWEIAKYAYIYLLPWLNFQEVYGP
ncbi:MAG TPA: YihY/virulence factor BrkB family protein, partial [Terriglobales bacterium]|nr:YihY/virulence factor BrkB family protein [Terriglobales bacterium]